MPTVTTIVPFDHLLDIAALAAGITILGLLILNRRRYGRFYLTGSPTAGKDAFATEMSQQLLSQQSQKAYDKLQRALMREFEPLCGLGGARLDGRQSAEGECFTMKDATATTATRYHRYRLAEDMLARGADRREILQGCGLAPNEFALLQGLHRMAPKKPRARR